MRLRQGARVLLLDEAQRLLLFKVQDASMVVPARPLPSDTFWVTVGGGLEPGETFEQAARREVWEETGIRAFDLGAWVWVGEAEVHWQEDVFRAHTRYYLGRTSDAAVTLAHMADQERAVNRGHRWWSLAEMRATGETLLPLGLPDRLADLLEGRWTGVVWVE
jgi:8-oxo-dGTP pyrophosphatase MutT (NUDIX family)